MQSCCYPCTVILWFIVMLQNFVNNFALHTIVVHHFWYTRKCPLHLKFGLWFISRILETGKQLKLYQICRIYGEEAMSDEMSWRGMWLFNEGCKNMYIDELTIFKEWWCSACSWKKDYEEQSLWHQSSCIFQTYMFTS